MAENTSGPMCTEQEYTAAREAGLLFVTHGTTAQERAIHRFAEAVRKDFLQALEAEIAAKKEQA